MRTYQEFLRVHSSYLCSVRNWNRIGIGIGITVPLEKEISMNDQISFDDALKQVTSDAGKAIYTVSEGFNFAESEDQERQVIDALINLKSLTQQLIETCYTLKPGLRPQ